MWNAIVDTFGLPGLVSCGKLRTTRIVWFCGMSLACGLCGLDHLYAQGPEQSMQGGDPSSDDRRGRRGRGGRGGFDPAQMIGRLDQNQDGVITENEVENAPGFARRMLQDSGLDFRRGVRVEEIQQSAEQRMEEMRRQRDAERPERSDRPDRPDWSPPSSMDRGNPQSSAAAPATGTSTSSATSSSSSGQKSRTRVSPLLPDAFQPFDTDLDGQIALSEWRKGKRGPISQFMQYDLDGDGFLIAKEIAKSNAVAGAAVVTPPGSSPATPATTTANVVTPPATASSGSPPVETTPVTVSAAEALKATRAFDLLDKDKSGTVSGAEWSESRRLKPLFEKGGYDLAKPMTKDEFIQGYARVGGGK